MASNRNLPPRLLGSRRGLDARSRIAIPTARRGSEQRDGKRDTYAPTSNRSGGRRSLRAAVSVTSSHGGSGRRGSAVPGRASSVHDEALQLAAQLTWLGTSHN